MLRVAVAQRTAADLVHLPPTTKAELQALPDGYARARGFTEDNTVREGTSGSSGRTLHIDHSQAAYDRYFAFAFRHLSGIGYRPWHRVAYTAYDPLVSLPWERLGLGIRRQVDLRQRDRHQLQSEVTEGRKCHAQKSYERAPICLLDFRIVTSVRRRFRRSSELKRRSIRPSMATEMSPVLACCSNRHSNVLQHSGRCG